MIRKVFVALFLMVCGVLISHDVIVRAQDVMTTPAKFMSKAEILKGLDVGTPTNGIAGGQAVQIVPDLLIRRRLEGPNNASIHSTETDKVNATEVMVVLDGSGTFITGGNYVDTNPDYSKKDRAKGITGGVTHDVKSGDVVVIPPGTSHWFSKINGQVTMIEARFPGDVTKGNK